MTEEVKIAEATGYAMTSAGPVGPLVELAMSQAVAEAMSLGVADDTPPERVAELTGGPPMIGAEFIRARKLASRQAVKDQHRALLSAHQIAKASELHDARDA